MDKPKLKIIDLVPFVLGVLVVFGISIHTGLKGGLGFGLVTFGIFGVIVAFLLFVETKTKRRR